MKKVLHISKYYYPFVGGIEQTARDVVNSLQNEMGDQYDQRVFCFNHETGDRTDYIDDVEIIRAGCFIKVASQSLSFSYGTLLKKTMKTFDPDIVIFHYPNPFAAHYVLKNMSAKTKFIIYWHLDIVKQKLLGKLFTGQNIKLITRADKVIATSPNYIEGSPWMNQIREKCVVIPSCINVARLQRSEEVHRLATTIKKHNAGKIICLAVGRHTEYKGFRYLIEASKYLDSRFVIYITGKGELTEKLKKQASGSDKVVFLGQVNDEELKAYMTATDIFCFPSITKNEAFGLALAEAMYYEKVPVTFNIPGSGVNYVNIKNFTGLEVPNKDIKAYANAMIYLADNPELRGKFGVAARERVIEYFLDTSFGVNIRREINSL